MKRKYILILIVVMLAVIIVFKLINNKKKLDESNRPVQAVSTRIPVKTDSVREQLQEVNIVKTGNIFPLEESKIISGVSGTLQQLKFALGSTVRQGQVLAVLDSRLVQLDLQKSEQAAAKAKNDLDVYTELLQGKAATREKVNELQLDYTNALNAVAQNKKQMTDAAIKAPINGMISDKKVEQGVFVNTGTELGTIVNIDRAKVQVNLTEADVYQVKLGQPVKVTTDVYPGEVFAGIVSFISPQADATHNYKSEIQIGNNEKSFLRSGSFVYVDFSKKTRQHILLIPTDAITQSADSNMVYVTENNIAHQRMVRTGRQSGGLVEVISGLQVGEQVVTSGQINLKDGTAISVSK